MIRNPLSFAYNNKPTVKSFGFCWTMMKWAVEFEGEEAQALQQCLRALGNLASSVFLAASLSMRSSSPNHQYTGGHNFLTCPVGFPVGFTGSLLLVISFPCVWDEVRAWPFQSLGNGPPALGCWRRAGESAWECYPNTLARMRALTQMFIQRQRDGPAAKIKCWQHFIFHSQKCERGTGKEIYNL